MDYEIKFTESYPCKQYHNKINMTGRKAKRLLSEDEYLKRLEKYFIYYETHPGHNITVKDVQIWIKKHFYPQYRQILRELGYVNQEGAQDEQGFIAELDIYTDEAYYLDGYEYGSIVIELFDNYIGTVNK